jgi:4-hydroxy-tetrahydrodipicolinate synthase
MLYDIPPRSVVPIELDTLQRSPSTRGSSAVKDARGDLPHGVKVLATTGLAYYSGDDPMNLPWLAVGAAGFVSVTGTSSPIACARCTRRSRRASTPARARSTPRCCPCRGPWTGSGGVVFAKAALRLVGLDVGEPAPATAPGRRHPDARHRRRSGRRRPPVTLPS